MGFDSVAMYIKDVEAIEYTHNFCACHSDNNPAKVKYVINIVDVFTRR